MVLNSNKRTCTVTFAVFCRRNVSMYHAVGHSVFAFLEAMLTFEHDHIVNAIKALKSSLIVCNKFRKRNTIGESLGKMVKKNNYDQYTEEEAHAELCYAECLLLRAMLTFMEDETLGSFIKAGLKIRSCFGSYKWVGVGFLLQM